MPIIKFILISYIFLFNPILSQDSNESLNLKVNHNNLIGTKYYSTEDGILRVFINIWGNVNSPGRLIVDEGVDILTAISMAGGPIPGADLKRIQLFRQSPDNNGNYIYKINLQNYIDNGSRDELIVIRPNDTIIVPQKTTSYIFDKMASLNTLMSLVNLFFSIQNSN